MSSLATCIKKAGKALAREDADAIRDIYKDYVAAGESDAAQRSVDDYISLLNSERDYVIRYIESQGGLAPKHHFLARLNAERDIAQNISSTALLSGEESLDLGDKPTTVSLAKALVARTLKANRGKALTAKTPRNKEILSQALATELENAVEQSDHAGNWYSDTLENAVAVVGTIHPEVVSDPTARTMFMIGLAVTSNGLSVSQNAEAALDAYLTYRKMGRFGRKGYGDKAPSMVEAFGKANELIRKYGLANTVRFLNTEFTVGELKELGYNISGENIETVTYGSAIFGPKVGGGFFQNLMGNYKPLTMDRWWMRTWGRLTGGLLPDQVNLPVVQTARLVAAIEADPQMIEKMGFKVTEVLENDQLLRNVASILHREYARTGFKIKTELNKAGKNFDNAATAPIIAPKTGADRQWMRAVANAAIEKLTQRGIVVNSASMQALLWFPEKELYLQNGVGNARSIPTDYEQEFAKLAAKHGVDQSRIEAARTRDTDGRLAGATRDIGRGAGAVEGEDATSLSSKERKQLLHIAATQRIRQQFPRPFRRGVPKGAGRKLDGVEVAHIHAPVKQMQTAYARVGLATPTTVELSTGEDAAKLFHAHITAAKNANKSGASVHAYEVEEYESMRLFLTEDGTAGFALDGDDIISLFKSPASPDKGVAQTLLSLAVAEGGRRLDAFDTVLPALYSLQGFKAVSRIAWDESQKPDGWTKTQFSLFNNGEPDVVFMVYDRNNASTYQGQSEGEIVEEYGEAVEIQKTARDELLERNVPDILYRLEDETKETIDKDPTSPLARLHKLGATMEAQSGGNTGVLNVFQALKEIKDTKGISTLLALIPRRNLADFIDTLAAPAIKQYILLGNKMSGRKHELLGESETLMRTWARYVRKNKAAGGRLADVMHASTLAGVDPSQDYLPKYTGKLSEAESEIETLRRAQHEALVRHWNRMDADAKGIFNDVRDAYIERRTAVQTALLDRIEASEADGRTKRQLTDELRAKFESGNVSGPYFPLMRYGDLWAAAKNEEGEVLSYSRFENRKDMQAWVNEWKAEEGVKIEQGRKKGMGNSETLGAIDPAFVARVQALVGQTGDETLADEIWQLYLASLPELSMRKQLVHRKGRLGFAADALRGFGHTMQHTAHQLSKLEYMHKMVDELQNVDENVRAIENKGSGPDNPEFNWATPVYNELIRRHKASMSASAAPWAVKLTGFGFAWYLGATPAAAVVNLTQTALVSFPMMAARFNSLGAFAELSKALKLWGGSRGNIENRLRGDEYNAVVAFRKEGGFEKTLAADVTGIAEEGSGGYGSKWHTTMEVVGFLFHHAERLNREVTFLASYRLSRKAGRSHEDAIGEAGQITWDSHFDYNQDNRPVIMQQDIMRVIMLFKQYSLNMTYRIARDFNDSIKGKTKSERIEARKRFGGMMAMAALLSGYTGLPTLMTTSVEYVLDALFGDDDDEAFTTENSMRAWLTDMMGAKASEAIMNGPVDAFLGLTLSVRVSLGQLWMRDPTAETSATEAFDRYAMELLGPVIMAGRDITATSVDFLSKGFTSRGIEKMTPKAVRDILRAYRYATEGAMTMSTPQDVLVPAEDFTALDIFWQAFGFTPARLTLQYEQNNALRSAEKHIIDKRSRVIDRFQMAAFNEDKTGAKNAAADIGEFNKQYPMYAITGDTLQAGAKARAKRAGRSIGGVTLNKNLVYLYRDMLFTDPKKLREDEEEE